MATDHMTVLPTEGRGSILKRDLFQPPFLTAVSLQGALIALSSTTCLPGSRNNQIYSTYAHYGVYTVTGII